MGMWVQVGGEELGGGGRAGSGREALASRPLPALRPPIGPTAQSSSPPIPTQLKQASQQRELGGWTEAAIRLASVQPDQPGLGNGGRIGEGGPEGSDSEPLVGGMEVLFGQSAPEGRPGGLSGSSLGVPSYLAPGPQALGCLFSQPGPPS